MFAASKTAKAASAAAATDPQFPYVTMLLHGDGTNGAQNNTFLDSSTNNFTITRNGNTTQGTFTPYGSNWSNYFDGSGDYLTAPNSTAFDLSTSDFTIEGFFYPTVGSAFQSIFAYASNAGASISDYAFQLLINSSNGINFRVVASGSSSFTTISTSNTFTLNSWNYVCVTRTGTSVSIYLNGTTTTGTIASTIRNNASSILTIGRDPDGTYAITGYLSNLRILKGTAVTPSTPTTPLTAVTNTSLLTCQSNRFIDNSTNNFTITKNGDTSVQRFSPFSPTTAYSTSVIGGSGYFDGSGDYLSASDNAALQWSTGDFCVEAWIYPSSVSGSKAIVCKGTNNTGTFDLGLYGNKIELYTTALVFSSSASLSANTWTHVAVTRSGTTLRCFINGALDTTVTSSYNFNNAGTFYVGVYGSASANYFNGLMSDVRCVKGSAVYTSAFTPPTAPLTAITNTQLLLSYTNAGILDNAMMNDLETRGNAQISTSVKKYGTGSMVFDATDDRLVSASSPNIAFGTGDFTVEFWLNSNNVSSANQRGVIQTSDTAGGLKPAYTTGIAIYQGGNASGGALSGGLTANVGGTFLGSSSAVITTGTWYHIALVRSSGTSTIYVNGTSVGSATTTGNCSGQNICVGGYYDTTYLYSGYIDDLRITKGYARYTSNFTAPTAAFPNN